MLKNKIWLVMILSIILLIFSMDGSTSYYKYTQESGTDFYVGTADKSDALEDTNEMRQIIDDLGALLAHSKRDGAYPKDETTGGTLAIPNSALYSFATGTKGDIWYCSATDTWIKLNIGSDDQMLVVATDLPNWETPSSSLLSDVASIAMLDENEAITGAWTVTGSIGGVNTTEFGYLATITAFGASIIDDADEATFKATVNLEIGTDVLAYQAIGIADDNLVEIDDADAAVNDYCKLTANGIVGRSYSEVKTDLGIDLTLYYLKTEIDTIGEVEAIWVKDIIDSDELAALKFTDLTDTPANYTDQAGKYVKVNAGETALEFGTPAGGASQLSDLSDVNTSTPTDKFVLVADGVDFESRALVEADISDFGIYLEDITGESIFNLSDVTADPNADKYAKWDDDPGELIWVDASGYTNLTSFVEQTAWRLFYSNTDGDVVELALGADGTCLKSNGAAAAPTFGTPAGAGTVTTSGTPVNNDYAKFTDATTIEGRSYSEVKTDLAYQLSDMSDVGVTIPTDTYVLIADGDSWESRALADGDIPNTITISDLQVELDAGAHSIGFTLQSTTGDGTTTIDWRLGNKFKFTFGAQNETFTFTAPTNPCTLMLTLIQDGTGSRTITWPGTCKWPGGTEGTLTTTANARDKVALDWDGTQYDCQMANDFK